MKKQSRQSAKKRRVSPKPSQKMNAAPKAECKYVPWQAVEQEVMNPLLMRQLVVGQKIMLARLELKKGCIVPEHSHYHEQVTFVLDGALKFWIDGKEVVVQSGEVLTIPPHMPHRVEALVDTLDIDIFSPPREDWINKTDNYLRGTK